MPEIESLAGEEWREISRAPGYWVSSMGRICGKRGHLLSPSTTKKGYLRLTLYTDEKAIFHFVHRLVLEAFLGPCPENMQCRHLNGKPADDRLSNLTWGTTKDNRADRSAHGNDATCDEHGSAKLTWEQVDIIRAAYASRTGRNWGARRIAAQFGISSATPSKIAKGTIWKKESPLMAKHPTRIGEEE